MEIYIITAEPVGSKAVAQQAGLDISTATIRNEMADLTETVSYTHLDVYKRQAT